MCILIHSFHEFGKCLNRCLLFVYMKYWLVHIPKTGGTSLRISGIPGEHKVGYKQGFKNLVIIRNPIDRTISQFKEYLDFNKVSFFNWFDSKKHGNYQTRYLMEFLDLNSLEEVKKFLKEKVIVIPTDKINEWMQQNGFKPTHTNKARHEYTPSSEEIELIKQNNELDFELYDFVLSLNNV